MFGPKRSKPVVLAVSSGGGHWVQMQRLAPAFGYADVHYATTEKTTSARVGDACLHVYPDANKDTPLRL
ncbi:MAG: UDP-N-acetylglucosamine--LPS N-acetylglucosamine transferase, partial [Roseobacter sp.]